MAFLKKGMNGEKMVKIYKCPTCNRVIHIPVNGNAPFVSTTCICGKSMTYVSVTYA